MYKLHLRLVLAAVMAVCLTTAACGGGDGSGGAVSDDTASTKSSSAPSAPSASNTRFDSNANLTVTYPTPTEEGEYGSIDFLINNIFDGYNFEILEVL